MTFYDVVIVGGGPAGLQAALILARCRRTVLVIDGGHPRNAASRALRGFLTRDGTLPGDLLRLAWRELGDYPEVARCDGVVTSVSRLRLPGMFEGFRVAGEGFSFLARKLVLATGVKDELPEVPGLRELYGERVFHCPFCDGYELAGQRLLLLADGERAYKAATFLLNWTDRLEVLLHGGKAPGRRQARELAALGVRLRPERVERLEEAPGGLSAYLDGGAVTGGSALFFSRPSHGKCSLAEKLGAKVDREGAIWTSSRGRTSVPGLYAAGNVLRDVMLSIVAAGRGCEAAFEIAEVLVREDRENKVPT